jgi:cytosine/adenosine deaminase-related metal-dependent hydrolase
MNSVTCIRRADWILAFDPSSGTHCYRRNADIAFAGDRIVHVGDRYQGRVDEEINGGELFVMPGLVNIHTHSATMPLLKGIREDMANPRLYMSALYDGWNLFATDPADKIWNSHFAYAELLRSGVTTVVDMCYPFPGWIEAIAASGLRGYVAPLFESARWGTENGHSLHYKWSDDGGRDAMGVAFDLMDEAEKHGSGRLAGMVAPMAVDTCTPALLQEAHQAAKASGRRIQVHAGESMMEFLEITRRTGKTQLEFLEGIGLLGPGTIIGHGIFIDHHSWLHWHSRNDIGRLADSGTALAHCPQVFARYGIALESFGAYRAAGVTIGIGTDAHPHNMIEEIRLACIMARTAAGNTHDTPTAAAVEAATLGGARALGRDDIGRLAVGAKADLVLIDLDNPAMMPVHDPLKCLVFTAADRAVRDVYVDGRKVVSAGNVLTVDQRAVGIEVAKTQRRVVGTVSGRDYAGRDADAVAPPAFPIRLGRSASADGHAPIAPPVRRGKNHIEYE